jgi:hypothetical protein
MLLESLLSPLNQLYLYLAFLTALLLAGWFYTPLVIIGGVISMILWMAVAAIAGISTSVGWSYYVELPVALITGYLFLGLFSWLTEKLRPGHSGEGFVLILAPLTLSIFIFLPTIVAKYIWQYIAGNS